MKRWKFKLRTRPKLIRKIKIILFAVISLVLIDLYSAGTIFVPRATAAAAEEPGTVYRGDFYADAVIEGLKYTDVDKSARSADAIYEASALGVFKGLDGVGKQFGKNAVITKEEAASIVYRAAGRENEALQAGIAVNNMRAAADRKTDPAEVLFDGFLQLAANDGMIAAKDLADALNADQTGLSAENFRRKGAAQRQEFAYWLAMALNMEPAARQQELYNFTDWRSVDPNKMLYLETMLQEGIISGSGGRINPRLPVTREQAAQMVKNAEEQVLRARNYIKNTAIIEDIYVSRDYTSGKSASGKNIAIANADGSRAVIRLSETADMADAAREPGNETGERQAGKKEELVVYKNGSAGDSSILRMGDRINYIVDSSGIIKYVHVISNVGEIKYRAVRINGVDMVNLLLDSVKLADMDHPGEYVVPDASLFELPGIEKNLNRIASNALIYINGSKAGLSDVPAGAAAVLAIDGNDVVREIRCLDSGIDEEAKNVARGIVEDNNPRLGYLVLYNEDGSGTSAGAALRTYNYADQNKTEIYKNHKKAAADDILPGDTAYVRLDEDGFIVSISAVDNYIKRYGRVISKLPSGLLIEYDDGGRQVLPVNDGVIVAKDRMIVGLGELKDGDRVRLLLNENGKGTEVKEIAIEGEEHFISNIYRGKIENINTMSGKITVRNMQVFRKGKWERVEWKGAVTVPFAEGLQIYANGKTLDIDGANRLLRYSEAYIAAEKTYGGEEKAVKISYRGGADTQVPAVSGKIGGIVPGSGSIFLPEENRKITYSDASIIVKYGRLVSGSSLGNDDEAYMTLDRKYGDGSFHASVVSVAEPAGGDGPAIFRGRINGIEEGTSFTLESYARLQGTEWSYCNTPITFNISFETRAVDEDGVLSMRNFVGYGDGSFLNRTVYVVADGINAVLVSTAPYGAGNVRGTVYETDGDLIKLRDASAYDASSHMWVAAPDMSIGILKNTIVMENGKIIEAGEIKKGAAVRVIKKDAGSSGDGYIIFVE